MNDKTFESVRWCHIQVTVRMLQAMTTRTVTHTQ